MYFFPETHEFIVARPYMMYYCISEFREQSGMEPVWPGHVICNGYPT